MAEKLTKEEQRAFQDFIDHDEHYDRGIALFEDAMRNAEQMLNETGGQRAAIYNTVFEQLNQEWNFFGQPATLSGKIYCSDDEVSFAPDSWGELKTDENGNYYVVDSAEVISHGVVDVAGAKDEVKFAYGYTPDDIQGDTASFFAFPSDILEISYDFPTLEAISERLHHRWPQEMRAVDMLTDTVSHNWVKDKHRLEQIARRVEPASNEEHFQEWLIYYLYERFEFDKNTPYAVKCQGPALYMGDDGEAMPFMFDAPRLEYLHLSGIALEHDAEKESLEIALSFVRPAALESPEHFNERIIVPVSSIVDLASTRPKKSLFESLAETRFEELGKTYNPEEAEVALVGEEYGEAPVARESLREIDRLSALESAVVEAQRLVKDARRYKYFDEEEAIRASGELSTEIFELFSSLELRTEDVLSISGEGVMMPEATLHSQENGITINTVDSGAPRILMPAYDAYGRFEGVGPSISTYHDEEKDELFHLVQPKLALVVSDIHENLSRFSPYPLLTINIKKKALVSLDGSAEISVPQLKRLRRQQEALAKVSIGHRKERIKKEVISLQEALKNDDGNDWYELNNLKRLHWIAREIKNYPASGSDIQDYLRELFSGRKVKLQGSYIETGIFYKAGDTQGVVADVTAEYPGSVNAEPAFAIVLDRDTITPPRYVPLSSITHFMF